MKQAIQAVCLREELSVNHVPGDHAGGKWHLRYGSALGGSGNLEIDLNFMYRVPLWPIVPRRSVHVGTYSASDIPLLDLHELAAGKLAALFARQASRDLFDAHQLLTAGGLNPDRLRLAFLLYGAMNRRDWRSISLEDLGYDALELENQLLPVLSRSVRESLQADWALQMVEVCRECLSGLLRFTPREAEFLDRLLDHGEIMPGLLTDDAQLGARILIHPLLQWKALNVQRHREGH